MNYKQIIKNYIFCTKIEDYGSLCINCSLVCLYYGKVYNCGNCPEYNLCERSDLRLK